MIETPQQYIFPEEPLRFNERALDALLLHGAKLGASDVTIQTGCQILMEIHGELYPVTRRALDNMEVSDLINVLYGEGGSAIVRQGLAVDPSYEIRVSRNERYRFRVNATACYAGLEDGAQITIRVIASEPPLITTMGVSDDIIAASRPDNGIVVISGQTGSGKSTLMASMIRSIKEDPKISKKIITYEAPIEYVFDTIEGRSSICQTELPRHLRGDFDEAVPNVSRRASDVVLIGESRNPDTLRSAISASDSGQAVYTTFHAGSVNETLYRMVNMFSKDERDSKMFEIVEAMRLLINQRLVPSTDGRRTALREYVIFDYAVRMKLRQCATVRDLSIKLTELMDEHGESYPTAARKAYERGLIARETMERFTRQALFGSEDET